MTYKEAEQYITENRNKVDDKKSEYKFMGLVIANNTAETREKERIYREIYELGRNNDFLLKESGDVFSDLNVFFVGRKSDGFPVVMPFSSYLETLS